MKNLKKITQETDPQIFDYIKSISKGVPPVRNGKKADLYEFHGLETVIKENGSVFIRESDTKTWLNISYGADSQRSLEITNYEHMFTKKKKYIKEIVWVDKSVENLSSVISREIVGEMIKNPYSPTHSFTELIILATFDKQDNWLKSIKFNCEDKSTRPDYQNDWNRLMSLCDKIFSMEGTKFNESLKFVKMELKSALTNPFGGERKQKVYEFAVEFIRIYNELKRSNK